MAISSSLHKAVCGARLAAVAGLLVAAGLLAGTPVARAAPAKPPLGWSVPAKGPSCWLQAYATTPGEPRPWRVGLGHVPQHASLIFVSLAHPRLARGRLAGPVRAWVAVDGIAVQAAGVSLSGGELLLPLTYRRGWVQRLASARSLAVILESGPWARRIVLTQVPLGNTAAVVNWLEACRRH